MTTSLEEIRSQLSVHSQRHQQDTPHPGTWTILRPPSQHIPWHVRGPGTALVLPLCLSKMSCPPNPSLPPPPLFCFITPILPRLLQAKTPLQTPPTPFTPFTTLHSPACVSPEPAEPTFIRCHVCMVKSRSRATSLLEAHLHSPPHPLPPTDSSPRDV